MTMAIGSLGKERSMQRVAAMLALAAAACAPQSQPAEPRGAVEPADAPPEPLVPVGARIEPSGYWTIEQAPPSPVPPE